MNQDHSSWHYLNNLLLCNRFCFKKLQKNCTVAIVDLLIILIIMTYAYLIHYQTQVFHMPQETEKVRSDKSTEVQEYFKVCDT
jgi:hypothetical protein